MKPKEGRARVVIEEVTPQIEGGRYPAKGIVGDAVSVTAAIFGDGHDHVNARLLYKPRGGGDWTYAPFVPLGNDVWQASFVPTTMGEWVFTIEAWVDHFDTWVHDLNKRLAAQPDPAEPTQQVTPQDIPLALRIGANHLLAAAKRATGADAKALRDAAASFEKQAASGAAYHHSPVTQQLETLVGLYPDLAHATRYEAELPLWIDRERAVFSSWYELFPRSCSPIPGNHGTLRDVVERLPEIAAMGFDIVYMPPIHPIGLAYRKGPNNSVTAQPGDEGSPWAIGAAEGGHTEIHPKLGTLADFNYLQQAARDHGIELALDIAFQCSPDHPWVADHPDWFVRRPDGSIQYAENPPKKYQDIYPLNFESSDWRGLWDALYGVFEFWVGHGVRVFRVDNPHTKALPFWEWCIAEIHRRTPDALFLAEAFTRPHVMYSLAKAGYTQSYTYFTWRTKKMELMEYFTELSSPPVSDFFRPNVWPNTPDILHDSLQIPDPALRRAQFSIRAILAATLSSNWGIYGPAYELCEWRPAKPSAGKTSSEEYLDSEKYEIRHWDRSDPISIAPLITLLNRIRKNSKALQRTAGLTFHSVPNDDLIVYSKRAAEEVILVVVSLDPKAEQTGWLDLTMPALGLTWQASFEVEDLLSGAIYPWKGQWNYVALRPEMPAHILRITPAVSPSLAP